MRYAWPLPSLLRSACGPRACHRRGPPTALYSSDGDAPAFSPLDMMDDAFVAMAAVTWLSVLVAVVTNPCISSGVNPLRAVCIFGGLVQTLLVKAILLTCDGLESLVHALLVVCERNLLLLVG